MTTPVEEFTIALSKVSKRVNKWLRAFSREDREDVVAIGLAWCWEHREEFDPSEETLENWWYRHLRQLAYTYRRGDQRFADALSRYRAMGLQVREGLTPRTIDSDESYIGKPPIDHEIEKLLSGPRVGMKDCPPCWRCMYFEGWTPNMSRYKVPTHVDPEIEQALREIERRKINIGFGREPDDNVWRKL